MLKKRSVGAMIQILFTWFHHMEAHRSKSMHRGAVFSFVDSMNFDDSDTVRLQITSGGCRTEHGQAIRTEFIGELAHIEHVQVGKTNSSMNSVRIA